MNAAIIITAYNRPTALRLLLGSLDDLKINCQIPLIISIDNNGTEEVNQIAKEFVWKFGKKEVIIHKQKKGLVKHFIWTGDQTENYDVVIFLEDDLLVGPYMIQYVEQVYDFYKDDGRVAAASLYNPFINEATGTRFYQVQDGYDNYFLQQPYWGHVWFKKPWKEFSDYLEEYVENVDILPPGIKEWKGSFKKKYIQYLIEKERYVVTPRVSLLTNNGIPGIHSGNREIFFQCPFTLSDKKYSFSRLDDSIAIYDAAMELKETVFKRFNNKLRAFDFEVDIFGHKDVFQKEYVLTSKPVKNAIMSFSSLMKPTELSVLINAEGNKGIRLARKEDVIFSNKTARNDQFFDITKNYPVSIITSLTFLSYAIKRLYTLIKNKISK